MREIKFRAWNKQTNTMVDLKKITPLAVSVPQDGLFIPFGEDYICQQFTGILDINGKEVFEGDIVQPYLSAGGKGSTRRYKADKSFIKYADRSFFMAVDNDDIAMDCVWYNYFEVIGNIYEHSHLLDK